MRTAASDVVSDSEAISVLRERLERYSVERYPIQHATARFHLGVLLTNTGEIDAAIEALRVATDLFDPARLPEEHAKALVALGAALRAAGQARDAVACFASAAEIFRTRSLTLEQGAALFNLGVAQRDLGDAAASVDALREARKVFDAARAPRQAAAAARELGAALVEKGDIPDAVAALEEAVGLAEDLGDAAGSGAASNALGLALLASGREADAVDAFTASAAANPRTIRPEGYAMAKANLALALEAEGRASRARLAALQALSVPDVPAAVRAQAAALLERLGRRSGELPHVLDEEPPERWPALVREELARWTAGGAEVVRSEMAGWIHAQAARESRGTDLAEVWLGALLELSPRRMEEVVRAALEVSATLPGEVRERWKKDVSLALPRFHPPQWMRMKETFNRAARDLGQEPSWG